MKLALLGYPLMKPSYSGLGEECHCKQVSLRFAPKICHG